APTPAPAARPDVPPATPNDLPAPSVSAPALDAPAARRVHQPHLDGATFDLDVHDFEDEERVQHYVRLFTGNARTTFTNWLSRGSRYEAMIRTRLRAAGLPEDLRFLPLVESGYDQNAVSRASAVGMWQFMAPTARELGLRVDWWVDERRDPVRSTDAAVRMLRWLRGQYGSHFVAAAAYNGGPTRVSRGLAQLTAAADTTVGEARFFALAQADQIRPETKNYVPQLIAATLVGNELSRYGLTVRAQRAFAYDSAFVEPLLPVAAAARAAGASRAEFLELNPQLLRGITPPGGRTLVRLPDGAGAGFAARLAKLDAADRRAFRRATTKKRDRWEAIAEREDVPLAWLTALNQSLDTAKSGKWKGRIIGGQALRVPTKAVLEFGRTPSAGDDAGALPALPAPAPEKTKEKAKDESARVEVKLAEGKEKREEKGERKDDAGDRVTKDSAERAARTDEKAERRESAGRLELPSLATVASTKAKPSAAKPPTSKSARSKSATAKPTKAKPAKTTKRATEKSAARPKSSSKSTRSAKPAKAATPSKSAKAKAPQSSKPRPR
ncbi:transglycosylase SLT domain-containing protein, partial [Roseisolibacter sp. H3M3-2]|uniref:transglycosylase SLT domain-containing protein n=1 Tax=Roseisolibacter sp. H3M3-2 TaxID=3031323 RepID=UPI0023DC8D80